MNYKGGGMKEGISDVNAEAQRGLGVRIQGSEASDQGLGELALDC